MQEWRLFNTIHCLVPTKCCDALNYLLLGENDEPEQLVLKSCHSDCEVDDRSFGAEFWTVGRIAELRRDVEPKRLQDVQLFVTDPYL